MTEQPWIIVGNQASRKMSLIDCGINRPMIRLRREASERAAAFGR